MPSKRSFYNFQKPVSPFELRSLGLGAILAPQALRQPLLADGIQYRDFA